MVYLKDWEDFEIAAENMYIQNPGKCRFTLKYIHSKGLVQLKFTDNEKVCHKQQQKQQKSVFNESQIVLNKIFSICSVSNSKQRSYQI